MEDTAARRSLRDAPAKATTAGGGKPGFKAATRKQSQPRHDADTASNSISLNAAASPLKPGTCVLQAANIAALAGNKLTPDNHRC